MMLRTIGRVTGAVLVALVAGVPGLEAQDGASLEVSRLVTDHMVLQRGAAVPIDGRAAAGATVVVTLDGETLETRAGADGRWRVVLPSQPAGGPYALTIRAGPDTLRVRDVLIGDVWVASGQSNMEWKVADARDAASAIAAADDRRIRNFRVPKSWSYAPEQELAGGDWEASDSAHVGDHSAVAYFFARQLREHVGVPIGIIDNSWGGARIEPFMSADAAGVGDAGAEAIRAAQEARVERLLAGLRERVGRLPEADPGLVDGRAVWADPLLDDGDWARIDVPGLWEDDYPGLDGVAWYRLSFELSAAEAAAPVHLGLGMIDDGDITWVNGVEVGGMEMAWNRTRRYRVPAEVLTEGRNVVAVRVVDTGGGGGIHGPEENLYLETVAGRRPLVGEWRFKVGEVRVGSGEMNQVPTVLYNRMVHPLLDYPIRGVIWYQGESNAHPGDAFEYRRLFVSLIRDWREGWGRELPFLWVQLANFMEPGDGTTPSDWAMLRESQTAALALPKTGQAVAIDVGEADDIHPRNKQAVGARLARAARATVYGQDVVYSGPVYRSHEVRPDGRVEITFDHVGGGLVARGGSPDGFAIAGADGDYVVAEARIDGDRVVVWSEAVPDPVAVRYAWADNPVTANLYNEEGLPATPFRTDRGPDRR